MSIYLKKSIAAIVMALSLGHAVDSFAANSSTGPEDLDTIFVPPWDNPYDVANDAFNWTLADYQAWDVGMSDESGGGGTYNPTPTSTPCDFLRLHKPQNCPNPIPLPNGYAYGRDAYPGGSGIPRLLYWIDLVEGVHPAVRDFVRRGLSLHTIDIAQAYVTGDRANERLLLTVQAACNMQHAADQQNPLYTQNPFGNPESSPMERNCLEVLERLQAEAGDPGFRGYFFEWLGREGIHLDDLGIPESVVDWLSPSNSLRIRHNVITADAQCAQWWIDAQANQCTL